MDELDEPSEKSLTARSKLAHYAFKDETQETIERGEYGMILLGECCVIHLFEDDAISPSDLSQYDGQESVGSFFLKRSQLEALIAKLRKPMP